jgi:DNA-binding NtrC family response regulator
MTTARQRTLLIIEDEEHLSDALGRHLVSAALQVSIAPTAAAAARILAEKEIDVVLLDQKLPDAEGHTLCPAILEANERAKIIFTTAFPSFENAMKAIRAGATDYLSKPFELGELKRVVDRCLRLLDLEEIERLHQRHLVRENRAPAFVGEENELADAAALIGLCAASDSAVLITGETGTGKSLVARRIHAMSGRRGAELVSVNCAAIPESLIDAELFGHERGAFTGATATREGLLEMADGGTLFLDEIGEMPLASQAKLLGALDEKRIRRVGGRGARAVDFRLIAATNLDLEAAVRARVFREDLFYRLNVIRIHIPPLRERLSTLPALCDVLLGELAGSEHGRRIAAGEIERLAGYSWPGNVRELRNVLERSLLTQGAELRPSIFLTKSSATPIGQLHDDVTMTLADVERRHIRSVLDANANNLTRASRVLGISISTLKRRTGHFERAAQSDRSF